MIKNYSESAKEGAEKTKQRLLKSLEVALLNPPEVKVGTTPHEVVYRENKLRLLHYLPVAEKVYPVPLLMVFALVNRPYILDLKPGRSVIEVLLKHGIDIYLIDWGIPGSEDKHLNHDYYINKYMRRVVDKVKKLSGSDKVSMLGYCMGGTMSAMYTTLYPEDIKNLILMTAGIDFKAGSSVGMLNVWGDKSHFDVDKFVEAYGNAPPEFLQASFLFMKPVQNLVSKYVNFYEKADDKTFVEDFFAMEKWLNDNIPVAGEVFREFIKYCFQENLLVQNKFPIHGKLVDLRKIECPVLNLIAEKDHLVPPASSVGFSDLVSSKDKETIIFPTGHIGLSVSSKSLRELWPKVAGWLADRSN
ncbi:MAG TPA: class III poly(R)-hydroxyalkanoic acid synthase subunit PhaC [Thermodesulfobacteriota bacterium]|nr:class III poly(R)-hydroxyalkanoic acid synthase subunit PhaC [Thermodesulfobacteriota bacterium]